MVKEICEDCNNYYGDSKSFLCSHCFEEVFYNKVLCMHCIIDNYAKLHLEGRSYILCEKCYPKYFNDK